MFSAYWQVHFIVFDGGNGSALPLCGGDVNLVNQTPLMFHSVLQCAWIFSVF